jgi:iron complex transport system substrate-binding protein
MTETIMQRIFFMQIPRRHLPNVASLAAAVFLSVAGAIATCLPKGFPPVQAVQAAERDAGRIVAIGGAITEILYALGLEQRVAGVDTTSLYPAEAPQMKANIGYFRNFSAEGVLHCSQIVPCLQQLQAPSW